MADACRSIEANSITNPSVTVGIIGQYNCNAALLCWRFRKATPIGRQFSDELDPITLWLIGDGRMLCDWIVFSLIFKGDCPRNYTSINFRKSNIHGNIAWGQTLCIFMPCLLGATGKNHLEDGAIAAFQCGRHVSSSRRRSGKSCSIENHLRWRISKDLLQDLVRQRVFKTRNK